MALSLELCFFLLFLFFNQHVMYLRELRLAQMERIMAEFIYGVDIYLSLVRDAKEVNPKVRLITENSWLTDFSCYEHVGISAILCY